MRDASLISSDVDLRQCKQSTIIVFSDFLLGEGMVARYWEQQSKRNKQLGDPFVVTQLVPATIVRLSTNGVVAKVEQVEIAHAQLSVSTNDLERNYSN